MLEFGTERRASRGENIVPMINVVFLLLIFFLMTASIAPPDPFAVTPPEAQAGEPVDAGDTLFAGPDGALAFGAARGEAVFAALSARKAQGPLRIRADAELSGDGLAALLSRLAAAGQTRVTLLVARK